MKTLKFAQIAFLFSFIFLTFSIQTFSSHLNNDYKNGKINEVEVFVFTNKLIVHANQIDTLKKGCIKGDCKNGIGVYKYSDGTRYEGEFKNGIAEGKGICYYADGDMYTGEWKNHTYHGEGIMYNTNGTIQKGTWKNGVYLERSQNKAQLIDNGKTWFIGIGISIYEHIDNLHFSDDDIYRMYAFLKSPNGGQILENQLTLLINEGANYENITTTLLKLKNKVKENDKIIFYYSGHISNSAIIPADGTLENKKIEFEQVKLMLSEYKAQTKIAIIDGRTIEKNTISNYEKELTGNDVTFIISAKESELSKEDRGLRQSVFSHFVIRGLKGGADKDNNNEVTLFELFNYIQEHVYYYAAQTPTIYGKYPENITIGTVPK